MSTSKLIEYIIEQRGDAFILYSIVNTNFGGIAKNYVCMSDSKCKLEKLIIKLRNTKC